MPPTRAESLQAETSTSPTVVVIGDDGSLATSLTRARYRFVEYDDEREVPARSHARYDVAIVVDDAVNQTGFLSRCSRLRRKIGSASLIAITGKYRRDLGARLQAASIYDVLAHPVAPEALLLAVRRALLAARTTRAILQARAQTSSRIFELVGSSAAVCSLRRSLSEAAESLAPLLLVGESSSSVTNVARFIHQQSSRSEQPFVHVRCRPTLRLETQLNALDAFAKSPLDRARGGTLLLTQVDRDDGLDVGVAISRLVMRLGRDRNIRIIGAGADTGTTTSELAEPLRTIVIPALRERAEDIPELADWAARRLATRDEVEFDTEYLRYIVRYSWPGNFVELKEVIEESSTRASSGFFSAQFLPRRIIDEVDASSKRRPLTSTDVAPLQRVRQQYIAQVLEAVGGNKVKGARILGISARTLYRHLSEQNPSEIDP